MPKEINMRRRLGVLAIVLIASCSQPVKETNRATETIPVAVPTVNNSAPAPEESRLIIPGKQVGKLKIADSDSLMFVLLGKADFSDAAMGKAWITWYGKKDVHNNRTELNVYTTYRDTSMRDKAVQQIRTTSAYFATTSGIRVYDSYSRIQELYPHLVYKAKYKDNDRTIKVYDETGQGIAFETAMDGAEEICTGIIVHRPGYEVTAVYLSLHPPIEEDK